MKLLSPKINARRRLVGTVCDALDDALAALAELGDSPRLLATVTPEVRRDLIGLHLMIEAARSIVRAADDRKYVDDVMLALADQADRMNGRRVHA